MNGKKAQMKQVAKQSQIISHINELGLSLRRPARDVVVPFFRRIAEPGHGVAFADAVAVFVGRIQKRAVDKRKEMDEAAAARGGAAEEDDEEGQELTKEERMGPGGLDPVEVRRGGFEGRGAVARDPPLLSPPSLTRPPCTSSPRSYSALRARIARGCGRNCRLCCQVFETLPEALQEAFQSQDTETLKAAIAAMPIEEAKHHMKRCEDSGLWVPG